MPIKNKASFLLLLVFAVFLGIVIFHPLSHGMHHDEKDGHECTVCLWLNYVVIVVFFAISLSIFLRLISRFFAPLQILYAETSCSASISRAPPLFYF
jgi:hypothetical protein